MKNIVLTAFIALTLFPSSGFSQSITSAVEKYSNHVHQSYAETLKQAHVLRASLYMFTQTPSVLTHEMAKAAWIAARAPYGKTEAFRFYNGPIDRDNGPEGLLNSWPLDEAYIDYVVGAPNSGIINNTSDFPEITEDLLISLNELDGEKNISTGYHAIEFLLWGQDLFVDGPGMRSYTDYLDAPNAHRRSQYLRIAADILVDQLSGLEQEWRAGQNNFRQEFLAQKSSDALKKILSGAIFMAGDELSGERMYVAYDTQGQEDEHSCFSDMTHMDIQWNYQGVAEVILQTGILDLDEVRDTPTAEYIRERLTSLPLLLASIPVPFDQAIAHEEGRAVILKSVEELEALALDLVELAGLLGINIDY